MFWNIQLENFPGEAPRSESDTKTIAIGAERIEVLIADTPEERVLGLSGRKMLEGREGMLFVFPEEGYYAFWMKDMRFAIDMCWLAFPQLISCVRNAPPPAAGETPAQFNSSILASAVLETMPEKCQLLS